MTGHPLDRLFRPRSVALVGASDRPGSNGHAMVAMSRIDGYAGPVWPVNPRLGEIDGLPCFPDLASLPEVPGHVVIGVASHLAERVLDEAIALGVGSATIFAACHVEGDAALPARIARKARAAGMALCGANCMGFYVPGSGLRVASVHSPAGIRPGGIAWIAQSGSAFGALAHNDRRLGFTLCVSTGMELATTAADCMDWALDQPQTRVIGLFLETVRAPARFVAALERAAAQGVPVVALKTGRTELSARMALSHSGAIAGDDAAYEALFRRHGVARVEDHDEMAATLALFDTPRRAAPGRLATVHDSGGEREMVCDLAADMGLEFAQIAPTTRAALARDLEPGLEPENPLDAYGTSTDIEMRFARLTATLVEDPGVALGFFMSDPRDGYGYAGRYTAAVRDAAAMTGKPLALVSNYSLADDRGFAQALAGAGVPLLRGTRNALVAARHLMAHRDFLARPRPAARPLPDVARWRAALAGGRRLSEDEGLAMLAAAGLAVPGRRAVASRAGLAAALGELRLPVALKTAEDHAHKSDVGGVVLDLATREAALAAYDRLAAALGPRALAMEMAPPGVELALGAVRDASFGPVVLIGAGGVLVELLDDRVAALAPFDEAEALRLLGGLRIARVLAGARGRPPADMGAVARQVAAFSRLVAALGDALAEIDVNPLVCSAGGAFAVDCLAIGRAEPAGSACAESGSILT